MPKASKPHTTPSIISHTAVAARAAEADYRAILARVPDAPPRPTEAEVALLDAAADRRRVACLALASIPATTLADQQAKARVLIEGAIHSRGAPPVVQDNEGLVWSLLNDLIAAPFPA